MAARRREWSGSFSRDHPARRLCLYFAMTATLSPRWTSGLRRAVLSNGLTLLVQRDPTAAATAVVTHVRAGFFDEPDRWAGVSHVLEHMFFKGTPTRGPGEVARETKGLGGYLNAHTAYDHTAYFVVLPPEGLAEALAVQSDALRNSVIDADELRRELQVIIEEAKRKDDSPSAVAGETLNEVMFDRHRIRRWRIGTIPQLERYTRDDIVGYYRSRYVPERVIVSIVGAVDPEATLALAASYYEGWAPELGAMDPSPEEPAHREVRARTLRGDVTQAELMLGWRGTSALDDDAIPLDMAAAVLATGRGSWLYQRLREPGIVTGIGAYHYTPTEIGVFSIGADLAPGRVGEALVEIGAAVRQLREHGPGEADLSRARALMLQQWSRRMERVEGRAMALAAAEALGGTHLLDEDYQRLESVSAKEVRAAAARYLDPGAVAGVVYLPDGEGTDLTAAVLGDAFARDASAVIVPPPLAWRAPVRRAPTVARGQRAHGVLHTALPGADLLVWRKPGIPLLTMGVYYPRRQFDLPAMAGLGNLAVRSAVRGAGKLDANGLAFALEQLGGSLAPSIASDWFGFGAGVLAEHAEAAAELVRLVLEEPAFRPESVECERDLIAEEVRQATDDMFRYPCELAFGAAFGDAAYGMPILGTAATLAAFGSADAEAWLVRSRAAARPAIIAVGDADEAGLSDALGRVFGDLPARTAGAPGASVLLLANPEHRVVERDRAQTALAMVFPGPGRRDPDRHAANVWAAIASGLGGRLFDALRDRRSLAYTVLLTGWQRARAGAMMTYIATSPEREAEARAAMLEELMRFVSEPVADAELQRAIRYLDGQARVRRQSTGSIAAEILEAWMNGDGLRELDDPGAPYRAITAEQVQATAVRSLTAEHHAEGVVRGREGGAPG